MAEYVKYRKPNPDAILGYSVVTVDEENPLPVTVVPEGGLPVSDPGGGGGAVDSVNGQTGAVVLSAEDVGAIGSKPSPDPMPATEGYGVPFRIVLSEYGVDSVTYVPAANSASDMSEWDTTAWMYNIPYRVGNSALNELGSFDVSDPLEGYPQQPVTLNYFNNHAATKQYVDDGFVGKLSGQGTVIATSAGVYGEISTSPGTTEMLAARVAATANTIAVRGPNGRLSVGTPASDGDATTKQYVDIRVPVPPATGTYTLQSVDGVTSWVAA